MSCVYRRRGTGTSEQSGDEGEQYIVIIFCVLIITLISFEVKKVL